MNKLIDRVEIFFRLIRFNATWLTTLWVIFGYLLAVNRPLNLSDWTFIIIVYIVFGPITYGSLLIDNDIADLNSDRTHPKKSLSRVIASGKVSIKNAVIIALILMIVGLLLGYLISPILFRFQLIFILINLIYTWIAKKIPFIDIFLSCITHPLRVYMGITLAGASLDLFIGLLTTHVLCSLALASAKRYREFNSGCLEARPVLKKYPKWALFYLPYIFSILAAANLIFTFNSPYLIIRIFYITQVILIVNGYKNISPVKKITDKFYYGS